MQTVVKKLPTKRGISSTLYDPRKKTSSFSELRNINTSIEFSNCIPPVTNSTKMQNATHGQSIVSSRLSFHPKPIEHKTKIKSNIVSIEKPLYTGLAKIFHR